MRVEESDVAVTLNGPWARGDARWGWSGGSAVQTATAGATASITFTGTSIRWIGSRGRTMGLATVSVDGGPATEVNTFGRPTDEVHTVIYDINDLSDGRHTLTIKVTGTKDSQADDGSLIVLDAFDIQPGATVSHWQETDANVIFTPGWTKSNINLPWSGTGASNPPELPVSAQESQDPGPKMTLPFRGTAIGWTGYRGPDAGIALVQVDGGAAREVDLYAANATYQAVVFSATGLSDANHTLTIESTGRRNAASVGARVVVDAFDVTTPGRRYEEHDPAIRYAGMWTPDKRSRVWTEGVAATSNVPGSTATFSFTGTSVSWIGCSKGSAGGTAKVYLDDVFVKEVRLNQNYPVEGYQITAFRVDGLTNGAHQLKLEVVNTNGSYIVVDAFDVHP